MIDQHYIPPGKPIEPILPKVTSGFDLYHLEYPKRKMILSPWLPERGLCMIAATRGIGKTYLALNIAISVASGRSFLKWQAPEPKKVLYIDGEMPKSDFQERYKKAVEPIYDDFQFDNFDYLSHEDQEYGISSLATENGQKFINGRACRADLIIIDNIATLCGTAGENDSDAWRPVQSWALQQRAAGRSVLFIHHANRNGSQRGTSAREDVLDSVISLQRPPNYVQSQGAKFEVHFTKARGFYGPDAEPFEAKFADDQWITNPIQSSAEPDDIRSYHDQGMSIREIGSRTGISKSKVHRMVNGSL